MLAGFPVEIYAALHTDALAIRLANNIDRQIQQEVIPDGCSQVNIAIFRNHFFVELFLCTAAKNVKLLEFCREICPERIKASITAAVDLSFKSSSQQKPLAGARKAILPAQVIQLQIRFDEYFRILYREITGKTDRFIKKVSNIGAQGVMYFFAISQ